MRVNTINQFKVLKFIEDNFLMELVKVEIYDKNTLKVTDHKGESANFYYQNGQVLVKYQTSKED